MDYKETLDYLFAQLPMFHRIGAAAYKADLNNTIAICKLLGDPHQYFKTIHVAGTNGKGSVSHFLASVLQECGYKTGLYTSPHLKDFRERIRINGKMIPEKNVIEFVDQYKNDFEKIKPSFFEWTVGLAFDYFRYEKVDIAVIETGLGGRLDSTNVIIPEISVITNIGWDHSNLLGDTMEKIAEEKAGIIKQNVPVIIGETQEHSEKIFLEKARQKNTFIIFADQCFKTINATQCFDERPCLGLTIENKGDQTYFKKQIHVVSELTGMYQQKNIKCVLAVLNLLHSMHYNISEECVQKGFEHVITNTGIMGRWQKLVDRPKVFCDTGHNEDGIKEILIQLQHIHYRKLFIVFGMVNDKDVQKILSLLPTEAVYFFCKANVPRSLDDKELEALALKAGLHGKACGSVMQAYNKALQNAGDDDLIYIGGSTFVVAEVL